jgi:glycosyltransferase involved in cell wall biosynthesis
LDSKLAFIYVSAAIEEKIKDIIMTQERNTISPAQNYHYTNIKGLSVFSSNILAIANLNKKYMDIEVEESDNTRFVYIPRLNNKLLRPIYNFIKAYLITSKEIRKNKKNGFKTVVIGDALTVALTYGALKAAKHNRVKTIAICTDLAKFFYKKVSLEMFMYNRIISQTSGFIFVIESMNNILNSKKKPYILMEGQIDIQPLLIESKRNPVVLFGGSMTLINGTIELVKAFNKLSDLNFELHLYGQFEPNAKNIILNEIDQTTNVFYKGIVTYDEMLKLQKKSYLLVSPRLTNQEYTLYSFPIKMLEYLSSGTPVLSTKLPCLSKDYLECIYTFQDESVEGFEKELRKTLTISTSELNVTALKAYNLIKTKKSIGVQSKRIYDFGARLL